MIKKASKEISKNSGGTLDKYNLFALQEDAGTDGDEENI